MNEWEMPALVWQRERAKREVIWMQDLGQEMLPISFRGSCDLD